MVSPIELLRVYRTAEAEEELCLACLNLRLQPVQGLLISSVRITYERVGGGKGAAMAKVQVEFGKWLRLLTDERRRLIALTARLSRLGGCHEKGPSGLAASEALPHNTPNSRHISQAET
jgi:hypothetical protein